MSVCIVSLLAQTTAAEEAFKDNSGKNLDVLRDGKPLLRHMYGRDDSTDEAKLATYKVYTHVLDPAGEEVITKGPGGLYPHHRGIFIGWNKLKHGGKSYDHWHMTKGALMLHREFTEKKADKDSATFEALIHWVDPEGNTLLEERRRMTVYFTDEKAHLLADLVSTLKAVDGEVELGGDPEHAGVQYRPHNEVSKNKSAAYTFHAEDINPKKDRDLPWVAMNYKLGDHQYTVQHMRHPSNPENSLYSAYRDYGRFGNFFVTKIADGDELTLRYRFRITLGETPEREALAAEHEKYVDGE